MEPPERASGTRSGVSYDQLLDHRRIWERKTVLCRVYAAWFEALLRYAPDGGRVLEVGAGPGGFSGYARAARRDLRWVATDLVAAPWNDAAADAQQLPFPEGCFDAVLGLDVLHHLPHPLEFLREARRVLRSGGALALVEPWVTPFSFPIYRWLHQEGCRPGLDPLRPFHGRQEKDPFDGDAAVLWRLLRVLGDPDWEAVGLRPPTTRILNGFAYLLSLGFRRVSLLPEALVGPLQALDRWLPARGLFGLRALTVWTRREPGDPSRLARAG